MPLHVCPACGTPTPARYCPAHQPRDSRPTARARGYTTRWEHTRRAYLHAHPYCECGCGAPATDVHHLDGQGPSGPRGHDPTNLQALAHACHSRLTAQHQPGGWAA